MTPKWIEYGSRFIVAGSKYFDYKKVRGAIALGKQVRFIGNPSNLFDDYAIRVLFNDTQIGWVPKDTAIQHGMWSEHKAKSKIVGVLTGVVLNYGIMSDSFIVQTLVLRKPSAKIPKAKADIAFSQMKEELSYMVK